MEAKKYLEKHWMKNKIWTHLEWRGHQRRLKNCTSYLKGKKFIDIGCGLGHSTNIMKGFLPGDWAGLEFWVEATEQSKKLFPEIKFYYSKDFNFLPICGEFDSVVCSEVIEHIEDDQALVDGLMKITKNILVITTPNQQIDDPGHLRIYTMKTLTGLFNDLDFWIVRDGIFFYAIIRKKIK